MSISGEVTSALDSIDTSIEEAIDHLATAEEAGYSTFHAFGEEMNVEGSSGTYQLQQKLEDKVEVSQNILSGTSTVQKITAKIGQTVNQY